MMLNKAGIQILKESEGLYLQAYKCPASVVTIGFGTVVYPSGKKVQMGDVCTIAQAEEWLQYELKEKAATIENWASHNKLSFGGNQFSALLCFAYNLGCGPIIDKDRSLSQALLHNTGIREAFILYDKVKGKFFTKRLRGLTIRREKEANLFFSKDA